MEWAVFVSPLASAAIAVAGAYFATKDKDSEKFAELQAQNAEQMAEIRALKEQVEKHNRVVERTFRIETEMETVWKRIDELKNADLRLDEKKQDK